MADWTMTLEVWPLSGIAEATFRAQTGRSLQGAENDQRLVGPRERRFHIRASNAREALMKAELIVEGIKSSDRVWECPIRSLEYADDNA